MIYFISFLASFFISIFFTVLVKKVALRLKIVDKPFVRRKIHKKPTPLLGGVAIYLSFLFVTLFLAIFSDHLLGGYLLIKHLIGMFLGGLILVVGGAIDDRKNLGPARQFFYPVVAAVIIIFSGIGITYLSNPFGQAFSLESIQVELLSINGAPYYFVLFADLLTFIWLLGMTYTTKILDGLDGLVSGLTVIAGFGIFFLSLKEEVSQPETALLSIAMAGSFAGFLIFNFYPAKIFLGEGGSTLAGFLIGSLSIISGGKLATALLIMSIPIVDLAFVIFERIHQKKEPFGAADNKHVHFRLLKLGLSQRKAVIFFYAIAILLAVFALTLQGKIKIILLIAVFILTVLFLVFVSLRAKKDRVSCK